MKPHKNHTTINNCHTKVNNFIDIAKHYIIGIPWESQSFENEGHANACPSLFRGVSVRKLALAQNLP